MNKEKKLSNFCKRANDRCTDGNEFAPSFIRRVEKLESKLYPTQSEADHKTWDKDAGCYVCDYCNQKLKEK